MTTLNSETIQEIVQRLGPQILTPGANQVAALPQDFKLQDIEQFLPAPTRVKSQVTVTRPEDFIRYVQRYMTPSALITVAPSVEEAKSSHLARCILDYHRFDPAIPTWGDHRVTLAVKASPEYDLLSAMDGKLLKQSEFAQKLSDLAPFIKSHAAADILEIVRAINLMSRGEFVSESDDTSGSKRFQFNVQVDARAQSKTGKTLDVPKTIAFSTRIFDGSSIDIVADLIFRAPKAEGEELMLGIRLPTRRWVEQQAIDAITARIASETGLLAIVGKVS